MPTENSIRQRHTPHKLSAYKALTAAALATTVSACSQSASMSKDIPFSVGRNYFAKVASNDGAQAFLVTSSATRDSLLGSAAVMGKNGMPTSVDMDKQAIIAIVLPDTDCPTEITPLAVQQTAKDTVTVSFSALRHEQTSYTMRPFAMLIVDKQTVSGKVVSLEENTK